VRRIGVILVCQVRPVISILVAACRTCVGEGRGHFRLFREKIVRDAFCRNICVTAFSEALPCTLEPIVFGSLSENMPGASFEHREQPVRNAAQNRIIFVLLLLNRSAHFQAPLHTAPVCYSQTVLVHRHLLAIR